MLNVIFLDSFPNNKLLSQIKMKFLMTIYLTLKKLKHIKQRIGIANKNKILTFKRSKIHINCKITRYINLLLNFVLSQLVHKNVILVVCMAFVNQTVTQTITLRSEIKNSLLLTFTMMPLNCLRIKFKLINKRH